MGWVSAELNYLAADMENWWALIKAVMKLPVLQNARGFLTI